MAGILDAAVGFALENLKEYVMYNANLIAGSEHSVKGLFEELEVLKDFLKKCTEEYSDNNFLDELAKNIRKLVYRAEDAIETYVATVARQRSRGGVSGALDTFDHALELRSIMREIQSIKQDVGQLYAKKFGLGIEAMQAHRGHEWRVKKPPVDDDMVGFKDEMEQVMKLLNDGPEDVQTVSIVGMLGLGKTTLAKRVFEHPTVEYQFSIRAFVEVSPEYQAKEVFLKILRSCGNVTEEMNSMPDDELAEAIRSNLEEGNFLIVLDDIWTPQAWDDLKRAFPPIQKRSRILITTRHKSVAEHARQPFGFKPHYLRFLTNAESRELLRKKVFGKDPFTSELEKHEARILDRCDGLPLAIVVVAGILRHRRRESVWWKKVSENVDIYNLATTRQANDVIKLSFNNLPFRFKPCFLYLGVFPEDFEIPTKTLLRLWISEGFVPQANEEESSEDIAEVYLQELVDRCLVMVEKTGSNGRIKTIRIHNILREFCTVQAIKGDLFREIRRIEPGANICPDDDRRLCINSNVSEYIKSEPSGKHVHSFLSFAENELLEDTSIPEAFKLLRVLDIRSITLTRFPFESFYPVLLKYIAISGDFKVLPSQMSNFWNLQTLIVRTSAHALTIKADIWKMTHLRHLETNVSSSLARTTEQFSINANLKTLSRISPESCTKQDFERAPKLRKLSICGKLAPHLEATGDSSLSDSISRLEFLENLKLLNDNPTTRLSSLPSVHSFPSKLTKLTLKNTMLDWEHMSTLGKLKKLEVLRLKENAFSGAYWKTENGSFRSLKVFHIGKTDLITWKASATHFPSLKRLYLNHCGKLEAIPSDLANIFTLQLINIYCCNSAVATSAKELQQAKLRMQAQDKDDKNTTLKLFIYPQYQ